MFRALLCYTSHKPMMAKVFFQTCFAQFKPPFYPDEISLGLFSSLMIDLQKLQKFLEDKPPSLGWCSEVVCVIKKIHSHFVCYLESLKVAPSWAGVELVDEYMGASLDLLDLCNLLRLVLSGLDRYRMMVDVTVHRVKDSRFAIEASKLQVDRVERARNGRFLDVEKWRETNFSKEEMTKMKMKTMIKSNNSNKQVLQAIRSIMSILSFLIVCSILNPTHIEETHEGISTGLPGLDSFLGSIHKLVQCFGERVRVEKDKGRMVLYEHEMIDDALASLKLKLHIVNGVEKGEIVESVEKLRKRCVDLKEGLDLFEGVMNDLFEDVIKGRKRVIEFINQNNQIA